MNNKAAVLRSKAAACQRLADLAGANDPLRKAFWLTRADEWNALAVKAAKKAKRSRAGDQQSADAAH